MPELNYVAIFLAALASYIAGAVWYSPLLFVKPWMKYSGMEKEDTSGSNMPLLYFLGFVGNVVMAFVLAYFIALSGSATQTQAIKLVLWLWLGFAGTVHFSQWVWSNKHFNLFLINAGQTLVAMIIMGAIIVAM